MGQSSVNISSSIEASVLAFEDEGQKHIKSCSILGIFGSALPFHNGFIVWSPGSSHCGGSCCFGSRYCRLGVFMPSRIDAFNSSAVGPGRNKRTQQLVANIRSARRLQCVCRKTYWPLHRNCDRHFTDRTAQKLNDAAVQAPTLPAPLLPSN